MKILFSAVLSIPPGKPGSIWHRLHYILGLRDLGHDVYVVEETYPGACVDDAGSEVPFRDSANVRIFGDLMRTFELEDRGCLLYDGGRETHGLSLDRMVAISEEADLLINLSGHLSTGPVFEGPRCRLYVDEDPVYTQLWSSEYAVDLNFEHHEVFATCGLNIGTDRSPIPDCSIDWIHTLPPVFLPEEWSPPASDAGSYTTVASWDVF
ncbi:MAG TPA: hypothetical protein VFS18_04415, partial [Actinomycetota bacterium]|nr:hypothetical protein [Actinomycetota bacterium]